MRKQDINNLAELVGKHLSYDAVWHDQYASHTEHNGSISGFGDPEIAFQTAKLEAEKTGFLKVDYWVRARIGDEVVIHRVDSYEGRT